MIKNEREYRIAKSQLEKFEQAYASFNSMRDASPSDLQVIIQADALKSQLDELQEEIRQYEQLKDASLTSLQADSIDELPLALIKARIASGLTQADLANRLDMKVQQVQRYEATNYASASFTRLSEVAKALRLEISQTVHLRDKAPKSFGLMKRLNDIGLTKDFIKRRLISPRLSDEHGAPVEVAYEYLASRVERVFGAIADSLTPKIDHPALMAARHKSPKNAKKIGALTIYAHYIALLALQATEQRQKVPSTNAQDVCEEIRSTWGGVGFSEVLHYTWACGIPVVPLAEPCGFHAAVWRVQNRNVIVLAQQTRQSARWLIDLLHEWFHAAQEPAQPSFTLIDYEDPLASKEGEEEEILATRYALSVATCNQLEEILQQVASRAKGRVEYLKRAVPEVATEHGIETGVVANALAYRLKRQKPSINWWPTATVLQRAESDPYELARETFFKHVLLSRLNPVDRELLEQALKG
jgi:transcriptional regulator with XRE-family HTH domain